ncbi:MAG: beta-lactamase family protein [Bacteroidales bacterium]|nr:beta-lactamase family protein [Bacteroidales bacterium]
MKKIKFVLLSFVIFGFLISCRQTISPETKHTEFVNKEHYVSIDGLWRVTPETAIQFPNGTLEPVIQISGDANGKLTARGCFLWDSQFYDYWEIKGVQYIDSSNQLVIDYDERGIYKGIVDSKKENIRGLAIWDEADTSDHNKIDFIRDENTDVNKLFIPYPSGSDGSIKYTYHQPEKRNDQLQTASIFEFVKDSTAFYNLIEKIIKQKFGRVESFIIIKDQKLILEEYFYGWDRSQLHPIHSCTKSITSLLLGITLERHKKPETDVPVFDFFPQYDSLKTSENEKITLKHVLTMTSGLPEDDDFEKNDPDDLVKLMLSLPLESTPGEKFKYNNNGTNILGSIINTLEKKQADDFAKEVLFNKLGISEFYWHRENDVLQCHSDLQLFPADMAKIGLLVLNYGSWNGEQIVPKEWINRSTKPQVAESEFFDYGYQWWYRSKRNKSWWENPVHGSNNEHDMLLALGYGGQFIMIIRDLNMVIVTTSSDYNESNGMWLAKVPMVIEEVVPLFGYH